MDNETEGEPTFRPDRYFILSDGGSLFWDPATREGADGFESAEQAAAWAQRQTTWPYGTDLDFSDGVTAIIALGAELNANAAAWDAWDGQGDWPDAPGVHNHALDVPGLVEPESR
jgi:hypothetical protein